MNAELRNWIRDSALSVGARKKKVYTCSDCGKLSLGHEARMVHWYVHHSEDREEKDMRKPTDSLGYKDFY